ncbi:MAG: hypothetical protein HYV04_17005 [Deltaproteobacteria bacterium]|nr:hypothetical protein [Deltaproteobacteria bacterium]
MLLVLVLVLSELVSLDPLGSPSLMIPTEPPVIAAEVPAGVQPHYPCEPAPFGNSGSILIKGRAVERSRLESSETLRSSPLDSARARGYRAGLPRNAIPAASPRA